MKNIALTLLLVILCMNAHSQNRDTVGVVYTDTTADAFDKVFARVEKEAMFPGGLIGWRNYLQRNLNAGLASKFIPLPKGQQAAQQTVRVQFIVNQKGKVSDVKTINLSEVHPRLAKEAERVIRQGPNWIPAEQGGRKVNYQAIQAIVYLHFV